MILAAYFTPAFLSPSSRSPSSSPSSSSPSSLFNFLPAFSQDHLRSNCRMPTPLSFLGRAAIVAVMLVFALHTFVFHHHHELALRSVCVYVCTSFHSSSVPGIPSSRIFAGRFVLTAHLEVVRVHAAPLQQRQRRRRRRRRRRHRSSSLYLGFLSVGGR